MVRQPLDKVEKFSYKTLITIVIILLIGIVALIRIQQKPTTILAEWFNDAWMYRQAINISSHSVGETNVYISTSVNIGTTSKSQPDNGDFRFTTASGQLLDYYIVSGAGTTNISFHINFDSFPSGAQTIYAYYGNSSADNGFSSSDFSTVSSSYSIGSPVTEEIGGGPVAWYKFDEGTGTTAFDSSTGSNNGSLNTGNSSPSWLTSDQCISGNCLSFDGNDNVNVGDNSIQEFSDGTNFTISLWIMSPLTSTGTVLAKKTSTTSGTSGYDIRLASTGTLDVYFSDGTDQFQLTKTSAITANTWTHLVIVFDNNSTTNTDIYINGAKSSASQTGTLANVNDIGVNTQSLRFGSESDSQDFIVATFDDVKLYSYARSLTQIKQDFTSSKAGQSSSDSGVNFGSNSTKGISDGLIAYYKFDEGVGTSLADSSGNNRTATLGNGDSSPTWSNGKFGVGASFDNTNDYIGVTLPNITTTVGGYNTVSFWMYWNGTAGKIPVNLRGGSSNYYELWFPISTCMGFNTGASDAYGINPTGLANKWVHVTLVMYNGLYTGKSKIYINGISQEMSQCYGTERTGGAGTSLNLGTMYPGQSYYFGGSLDEVRVYNRGLSPTDIENLYNFAPGPVGYWKFDEKSGTTAYDSSGKSHNSSSFSGSPTWITGKVGSALDFESSSNQWVNIPDSDEHDMVKNDFSVCLWLNPETTGPEFAGAFEHRDNTSPNLGYELRWDALSQMEFMLDLGATTVKIQSNPLTVGNWYYICSVASRNGTAKIYQDGKLIESQDISAYYSIGISSPDSTYIGTVNNSASFDFDGKIDDVKLYNYARTTEQILQDMAGDSSANPHTGKPLIWYKFDEGQNTVVNNYGVGGSLYHVDLGSGDSSPTWVNGKNNKALSFDGSNDSTSLNTFYFPNSENFTLSSWFNINTGATAVYDIPIFGNDQYTSFLGYVPQTKTFRQLKQYTGGVGSTIMNWVTTYQYADSNWHYVAVSVDQGSTAATLYLDGKKFSTMSIGGTEGYTHSNGAFRRVGRNYGVSMNGSIDEMKVYNYSLSDDEIKSDYNQSSSFVFGSSNQTVGSTITSLDYCVPGDTSPCAAPIAEYKMDEGVGTTAYDSSGNNKNGVFTNSPTWKTGKHGKGVYFTSGSNQYIKLPSNALSSLTSFTISTWAYRDANSATAIFATEGGGPYWRSTGGTNFFLYLLDSDCNNGGQVWSVNNAFTTGWHHYTLSIATDGTLNFYRDAQLISTVNYSSWGGQAWDSVCPTSSYWNVIGNYAASNGLGGTIDDFKIYNYARSPAQIAYDYNKGGPLGWWKLDECQGSTVNDSSGFNRSGTVTIGASGSQNTLGTCTVGTSAAWTNGASGKMNTSISLDGTDDSINIGNTATIEGSTEASVCSWLKYRPASVTTDGAIVSRYLGSNFGWLLWVDDAAAYNGNTDTISFSPSPGDGTGGRVEGPTGLVTTGQWDHYCGVFKGGNYIRLYKNGNLVAEQPSGVVATVNSDNANLYIGQVDNVGPRFLNGQVDDVRIYNYALTNTQIKAIFNGGSINFR